jgi:hypothetical protein
MANQALKIYATGYTGFLIIRYAEAATPTAYLGQTAALPFPVDHTYDILNLRRVVHRFEFWQSSNGTTLTTQIRVWDIDVAKQEVPAIEVYYYASGGAAPTDPALNQRQLRDARLLGKTYTVDEKGTGHLTPGVDYTDRSDAGGGFDLSEGFTFNENGSYMVTVFDKVVLDNTENTVSTGGGFSDVVIASESNNNVDSTFYDKLIECGYAVGGTGILNMQPLASIPDAMVFRFSTHLGNQQYLKIKLSGSETVRFLGKDRNALYLAKGESLDLLKQNGQYYVLTDNTGYRQVGQRVWGDYIERNTLLRDGSDHPEAYAARLVEWALDNLGVLLVDFTTWNTTLLGTKIYSKRFAWDSGSRTIRVPDSMNMYQRAVPTTGTPAGAYQPDQVGPLLPQVLNGQGGSSTGPVSATAGFSGCDSNSGYTSTDIGKILLKLNTGTETNGKGELLLPLVRI